MAAIRITSQHISDVIGMIYDCALDPTLWQQTLENIRLAAGFHTALLQFIDRRSASDMLSIASGISPYWRSKAAEYGPDVIAMWGGWERIERHPIEEPAVLSDFVGAARFESRYYREWKQPQGLTDTVVVCFLRNADLVGTFAMGRHESAGAIGAAERDFLRLLAPHFRRAASINRLIEFQQLQLDSFSATLDLLPTAIVLLDPQQRLVHGNHAAEHLLAAGGLLTRTASGGLRLHDEAAGQALASALSRAIMDPGSLGRSGIGIPARARNGDAAVLHVLPLRSVYKIGATKPGGRPDGAVVAVFIAPGGEGGLLPLDALSALYDLTPAEARVLDLLCTGMTTREIATRLGIASSTIKTHLLQLFGKTGCRRQIDLVRRVRAFHAPE